MGALLWYQRFLSYLFSFSLMFMLIGHTFFQIVFFSLILVDCQAAFCKIIVKYLTALSRLFFVFNLMLDPVAQKLKFLEDNR